jgi:hypothetical protein
MPTWLRHTCCPWGKLGVYGGGVQGGRTEGGCGQQLTCVWWWGEGWWGVVWGREGRVFGGREGGGSHRGGRGGAWGLEPW